MTFELIETNSERWLDLEPLLNEQFKDIKGYDGLYQISNYGRIKSIKRNKILICNSHQIDKYQKSRHSTKNNYYLRVHIQNKGKNKLCYIHRLVAEAFIPNPNNYPQVNHKNGLKNDNRVDNLEWCDTRQNVIHAYNNLQRGKRKKEIYQCDEQKKIIKIWNCMSDLKKIYNYSVGTLTYACQTGKKRYGFYWKYKE